ncbi:MAG: hypothetical protein MZW92_26205 [Comamonadaceae bacterium]|nr:hypothetical protein [Comamonadaceae bacterium]
MSTLRRGRRCGVWVPSRPPHASRDAVAGVFVFALATPCALDRRHGAELVRVRPSRLRGRDRARGAVACVRLAPP